MRTRVLASLSVLLIACSGGDPSTPAADSGVAPQAGQGGTAGFAGAVGGAGTLAGTGASGSGTGVLDGGGAMDASTSNDRGPFAPAGLDYTLTPGAPLDVPVGGFTYVEFPDAKCANGTVTGIAVSRVDDADGLLIFMQGGGACWDAVTCLELKASVHLEDTVGESVVLSEANQGPLFDRNQPLNPFRNYDFVYIPYCTGDLHTGTRAATYTSDTTTRTIEHHGGLNVDAFLARLVPTFADAQRVIVSGVSAGGYGATFNWWRYQAAFDHARVDVFDDAGLPIEAGDARFETMVAQWGAVLPPGCTECGKTMAAWLPFYAAPLGAPRKYALAAFLGDGVIGQYFGLDAWMVEEGLTSLRTAAAANQKTFFLTGTQHSVLGEGLLMTTSGGASLVPWLAAFEADAAGWDHAGP